jgi:hypothetical protein
MCPILLKENIMLKPRFVPCLSLIAIFCVFAAGCGSGDPFGYAQVSGKLSYEDGTLIPIDNITLTFYPQAAPIDAKTYPRPGMATVDKTTGAFGNVTSHKAGDGLVRGKHKVTITDANRKPLSPSLVPPEYADPEKTLIEVDTNQQPFVLKIRKPK